jgi:hypothetical protein
MIDNLETKINTQEKDGVLPPGLLEQLRHQISVLRNDTLPDLQLVFSPGFYRTRGNQNCFVSYIILTTMYSKLA